MLPFFALVNTASIGLIIVALLVYSISLGLTYGPRSALYAEMYPTRVRYSGAAISYAIGAVLGGAFAPTIAEALRTSTGTVYSGGAYLAGMTITGIVASLFIRDHPGRDLEAGDRPHDRAANPS
jgi:MFS family permease